MPDWMTVLLHYFALPEVGLTAVFSAAFISATLLPMATEPILFAYVQMNPEQFWLAIAVATVGNTAGGMLTYWMGYGVNKAYVKTHPAHHSKYFAWLQRLGAPVLLLSWLPLVGDALCAMAGWLKLPWRVVLMYMVLGKFLRFVLMTAFLLWVPHDFWTGLTRFF